IAIVVWMLLLNAQKNLPVRPAILGTLLAWAYVVRPTNSIPLVAIGIYLAITQRRLILRYLVAAGAWLSLFVAYSCDNFREVLPHYYRANRLTFEFFGEALAGNLISPSRGLLIYVPVVLFVLYLLARYYKHVQLPKLALLSLGIAVLQWVLTSGFGHWY